MPRVADALRPRANRAAEPHRQGAAMTWWNVDIIRKRAERLSIEMKEFLIGAPE
jgi:hypothetical protein